MEQITKAMYELAKKVESKVYGPDDMRDVAKRIIILSLENFVGTTKRKGIDVAIALSDLADEWNEDG